MDRPSNQTCSLESVWLFSPQYAVSYTVVVTRLYLTLCDPWTGAHQAPLSMGFSKQEYWSGLPFPSPN